VINNPPPVGQSHEGYPRTLQPQKLKYSDLRQEKIFPHAPLPGAPGTKHNRGSGTRFPFPMLPTLYEGHVPPIKNAIVGSYSNYFKKKYDFL
jgi:hypothetical protein